MLFNSLEFIIFFCVVYSLYLGLRFNHRYQNLLLLIASYVFYGFWDWRFLSLILLSTLVDFFTARAIERHDKLSARRFYLFISVFINLSILGFFKYFNFFAESFTDLLNTFGMAADYPTLNIILPLGISFYTFQTMSYTIDVYRRRLKPTDDIFDFALYVSFFPQLVAGPIERATHLLPQITVPRKITLSMIDAGVFLILWGFFKKVVIADNVAVISDEIFDDYTDYQGLDVLVGVLAFTVQIYCDFSGYSDIARGLCKLLGFDLMINFRLPYFALSPSDFWSRWHISLSTWLRDYLYIPLGGNRKGALKTYRNLMLTMVLGGLWHGAAWNFVVWGFYHGTLLTLYRLFESKPDNHSAIARQASVAAIAGKMALMFCLTLIGWLIFRAQSLHQIGYMSFSLFSFSSQFDHERAYELLFFSLPLICIQIWQYASNDLLAPIKKSAGFRGLLYGFILFGIIVFGTKDSVEFIYFQF